MNEDNAEHPAEFWQRKARALLRPSPFLPDGAPGDLIERCMRDARDAHVPGEAQGGKGIWCELRHPLNAEIRRATDTPETWLAGESVLQERAARVAEATDAAAAKEAYFALWHATMERGGTMPGSFVLPDHSVAAWRSMSAALVGARADDGRAALLYMHIGPVQGFIGASRRTHDLWVGSYTVGYLTMLAIMAIAEAEGPDAIVYPDLAGLPLARHMLSLAGSARSKDDKKEILRSSLANCFLAVVSLGRAPKLVELAQARAAAAWELMAKQAQEAIDKVRDKSEDMWSGFDKQRDAHLEVDAVVQPWPEDRAALRALLDRFPVSRRPELRMGKDDAARTGDGYGMLFDLCHRTLAAYRKTTLPPSLSGDNRPKCSQCGQREQMVPCVDDTCDRPLDSSRGHNEKLSRALSDTKREDGRRISYQLARGEGLCAVCWTKRMAPEELFGNAAGKLGLDWDKAADRALLRFPGVVTIASAPLRYRLLRPSAEFWETRPSQHREPFKLPSKAEKWLDMLDGVLAEDCLAFTPPGDLLYGFGFKGNEPHPRLAHLGERMRGHDGEWFYDSNYEPETAWRNHFAHDPGQEPDQFKRLKGTLEPARKAFKAVRQLAAMDASPYYAVLVLDGDDMGKWLTGRHEKTPLLRDMLMDAELAREVGDEVRPLYPALHRELARLLAELAQRLHTLVDAHLGRMVYSGGDDVMAFLPLATALPCARAIERAMRSALGDNVTASAGMAITHMRTPLSRALDDARTAEKAAKDHGKNRLSVRVAKRSGAPVDVTIPWRIGKLDVIETLMELLRRGKQDDEQSRPLGRVDVAYRLEHEFRVLLGDSGKDGDSGKAGKDGDSGKAGKGGESGKAAKDHDRGMFEAMLFERMRTLLSKGAARDTRDLVACLEPLDSKNRLNVLLLLRFLMREEHGIDTVSLLEDLRVWPEPEQETRR